MLHKDSPARERILLMGPWGAGKSYAWCCLGSWLRRSKSDSSLYVIDTDHAAARLSEGNDFSNIQVRDVWEWPDYNDAIDSFRAAGTREDWLIVDLADKAWDAVQNYYIEQAFGKNAASYFLDFKTKGGTGHALAGEYGANWTVINKLYAEWMGKVQRWPGHILACTPAETVEQPDKQGRGGDDKDTLNAFGKYGVKPRGQKALGFQFFTVLLLNPKGGDKWAWSSVKDLNREHPQNQPMNDFVLDYLVKVGGWAM